MSRLFPRAMPREMREMASAAVRSGWSVGIASSGHVRWRSPAGAVVATAMTPSCPHTIRNDLARLRRAGLDL